MTEKPNDHTAFDDTGFDETHSEITSMARNRTLKPVLVAVSSTGMNDFYVLKSPKSIIGRQPDCQIYLPEHKISRNHSEILYMNLGHPTAEPHCMLRDLGSKNGTIVNGKKITEPHELKHGDILVIGTTPLAYFVRSELEISADFQLRDLAANDPLTGLMNRRTMDVVFLREFERSLRYGRPLSVMMVDIDHFKSINDTYGHATGDEVLKIMAGILKSKIRVHDMVARYGGEEFALILPETEEDGAFLLSQRLMNAIRSYAFPTEKGELKLTASIGIAQWKEKNESLSGLIEKADQALYDAKRRGRDRVVIHGESDSI